MATAPKILLYTNELCPASRKVKITLQQLGLAYSEKEIDISTPRPAWYLDISPRGLVPALDYDGHVVTESRLICAFLADLHPKPGAFPGGATLQGALLRHRIGYFEDAWTSRVHHWTTQSWVQKTDELGLPMIERAVGNIAKELEPMLQDAAPYFGGSKEVTLLEALVGPSLLIIYTHAKHGIFPAKYVEQLEQTAPKFHAWALVLRNDPAIKLDYDEDKYIAALQMSIGILRDSPAVIPPNSSLDRLRQGTF